MKRNGCAATILALTLMVAGSYGQGQRDIDVRTDKKQLSEDTSWIYDDLDSALEEAQRSKRPLMVVFR
jgi:hypothetical protein